jgi:hypothetical protein
VGGPELGAVFGDAVFINQEGVEIGTYRSKPFSLQDQLFWNYVPQPSTLVRFAAFKAVGMLDPSLNFALDYDLWFRMGEKYPMRYLPKPLATYRVWSNSKSVQNSSNFIEEHLKIFDRFFSNPSLTQDLRALQPQSYALAYLRLGFIANVQGNRNSSQGYLSQSLAYVEGEVDRIPFVFEQGKAIPCTTSLAENARFQCYIDLRDFMQEKGMSISLHFRRFLSSYRAGIAIQDWRSEKDAGSFRQGVWESIKFSPAILTNVGILSLVIESWLGKRVTDWLRRYCRAGISLWKSDV